MDCQVCGSAMELWRGQKWICTNPNCTNTVLANKRAWYEELAESPMWNENIIKRAPSVIAYEYYTLREMLKKGEVSGIVLQLKDAFEVALKFPLLIVLSDAFENDSKKNLYRDILHALTCKLPSLGDWFSAAQKILTVGKIPDDTLKKLLKDICKVYEDNQIVNWRNTNIGHGAFTSTENENFRDDLISKIKILVNYFNSCERDYSKLTLLVKSHGKNFSLTGYEKAKNIDYSNCDLYFSISTKKKPAPLIPLIRNIANGIYFFDSYISWKNKTAYLNYASGHKLMNTEEKISRLYQNLMTSVRVAQTELSAEAEIRGRRSEKAVEDILKPSNLVQFDFLTNRLGSSVSKNARGVYLLEMPNGMGKTTFVKMLDGLSYSRIKVDDVMCRAFYINGVYSHSKLNFVQSLSDSLRRAENGDTLVGDIPSIDVYSKNAREQVASLINKLFEIHSRDYGAKKLLIVIDAVDELPNAESTVVDLIPRREQISEGVHILITCRTADQTSEYTKKLLRSINFDETIHVDEMDKEYHAVLKKFVADKTKASDEIVDKIISTSEGRMLSLENIVRAYLQMGEKFFEQAHKGLFEFLRELYGERYYNEILNFATHLALIPVPITIHDLARLADEEFVTFKLIAYIGELKPILDIRHTSNGTFIAVTRPEVRKKITLPFILRGLTT